MENIKTAVGYIRVSTVEQATKGLSIETQMAEIKAYAAAKNMKLIGFYVDRGITARKSLHKRIDFMQMMNDLEKKKFNHIIVLRLDRFFRNVYDYHRMMNEYLIPNKCDWSAVKEEYTTETTNGRLMINLRLSIAEQECDTDSDRIKDILDNRVAQGFVNSGTPPYGMKIVDKRLVKDPETNHIVKDAFDAMERLNSVRKVMLYLNEKYNEKFLYDRTYEMLKRTVYYGSYRNNHNFCEPTITKEQYDNVQRLMRMNVWVGEKHRTYIFSGMVKCAECNYNMIGTSANPRGIEYTYYRCSRLKEAACSNKIRTSEQIIENYLLDNVERLLNDYIVSVEVSEKSSPVIKDNRKQIENKLLRLNDLYVNGFIDMEKYKADYAALQSQIIEQPVSKKKDLSAMKDFLQSNFKEIYKTLSKEEKRALWRSVIKEIRVSGKEVKDIIFL